MAGGGGGTRVSLVHSGFGDGPDWDDDYRGHGEGWTHFLANLKSVLDCGADRRAGRRIVCALRIDAPPARVFRALIDPADLARWEAEKAEIAAAEGAAYRFDWGGGLHAEGRVLAAIPGERLELSYHVPAFKTATHPTIVTFTLEAEAADGRAKLRLVHSGFDDDASWDEYYRGHRECWDVDLEELATLCERGAPGRVVRREEPAPAGDAASVLDAFARAASGPDTREIFRDPTDAEGPQVVLERTTPAGPARVRARLETVKGERRLVVTEAFAA